MVNDSNIITINSTESKMKINKFSGNYEQETREGYNEFKTETYARKAFGAGIPQADTTLVTINSHDENNVNFTTISNGYFGVLTEPVVVKNGETRYISMTLAGGSSDIRVALIKQTGENVYESIEVKSNLANQKHEWAYTNNTGSDVSLCLGIYTNSTTTYTIDVSNIMITDTASKEYEAYGVMPSMDYPSTIETVGASGSETITKINKNFFDIGTNWVTAYDNATRITDTAFTFADITVSDYKLESENYTTEQSYPSLAKKIKLAKNKDCYISCKDINSTLYVFGKNNNSEYGTKLAFLSANQKSVEFNSGGFDEYYWAFYPRSGAYFDHVKLEINSVATDFIGHEEESYTLSVQQEMLSNDCFVKESDGWKEVHGWSRSIYDETDNFNAFVADDVFQFYLATTINPNATLLCNMFVQKSDWTSTSVVVSSNNNLYFLVKKGEYGFTAELTAEQALSKFKEIIATTNIVLYNTTEKTKLACTSEQITVLNELQNILLYDDTTHIVLGDIYPILDYDVSKIVDTTMTFEASLDENGYFVVPDYNIKCLVSYSESNIPTMPEAVESTVRVAGKDGDVVLGTTYEPISFTIVCYTDDNLSVEEKNAEELKMNNFLNSIKDKTIRLKIDSKDIFYNVKYNGLLTTINYPKHLRFSIPLKTSASFANNIEKSYMLGNATKQSNTAKKVGAIFTIAGPAQTPKIYLNDYEMFYNNVILSGAKLIIDSNRSTVTMVGRDGNLTNAMRYYNHEFPKIENGENVLKVSSGIDEDRQVSVEWFDLKL